MHDHHSIIYHSHPETQGIDLDQMPEGTMGFDGVLDLTHTSLFSPYGFENFGCIQSLVW